LPTYPVTRLGDSRIKRVTTGTQNIETFLRPLSNSKLLASLSQFSRRLIASSILVIKAANARASLACSERVEDLRRDALPGVA
jgi:hypothetical protein